MSEAQNKIQIDVGDSFGIIWIKSAMFPYPDNIAVVNVEINKLLKLV